MHLGKSLAPGLKIHLVFPSVLECLKFEFLLCVEKTHFACLHFTLSPFLLSGEQKAPLISKGDRPSLPVSPPCSALPGGHQRFKVQRWDGAAPPTTASFSLSQIPVLTSELC